MLRRLLLLAALLTIVVSAVAAPGADKKDDRPKIVVAVPMGVTAGTATTVSLRGQRLDDVREVRCASPSVKVKLVGKRKVGDVARVGNTLAEVELAVPANYSDPTVSLTLVGADGESNCARNYQAAHLVLAKQQEPNADEREDPDRAHDSRPRCKKGAECPALFAHSQERTAQKRNE